MIDLVSTKEVIDFVFDVSVSENQVVITIGNSLLLICPRCHAPLIPYRERDLNGWIAGANEIQAAKRYGVKEEHLAGVGFCSDCFGSR